LRKSPAPASNGFAFGGSAQAPKTADASKAPVPAAGGFSFGSTSAAASPPAPASNGFAFGGSTQAPKTADASKAPVPAAGGFSFGSSPAAATDKKDATKTPGFSFGGTPAGVTTDTKAEPAPTTGGFSFGAGSTPAHAVSIPAAGGFSIGDKTTPATPTTVNADPNAATPVPPTPSPVDTPQVKTPAAAAGALTTTSTPITAASQEPPSLEYQTLTVEQILNKFQKELEQDALEYLQQAKRVCEYDAVLRDSQRDLAHLTSQTQRLLLEQEQVEKSLIGVGGFQQELETTLNQVSEQVDELFRNQSHLAPQDADFERERSYQLASNITHRLEELEMGLNGTLETLSSQANNLSKSSSPGLSVITILNQHQDALGQLEVAAHKLDTDVTHVGRLLGSSNQ
jgi:hypothetical protein